MAEGAALEVLIERIFLHLFFEQAEFCNLLHVEGLVYFQMEFEVPGLIEEIYQFLQMVGESIQFLYRDHCGEFLSCVKDLRRIWEVLSGPV